MPNKSIAQGILKMYHSADSEEVVSHIQNRQVKEFTKSHDGYGIEYGNLMDFNASSGYNGVPNQEDKKTKKHPTTLAIVPIKDIAHHNEQIPHHLFRETSFRGDANEIVQN
jgi:hypothetical protein